MTLVAAPGKRLHLLVEGHVQGVGFRYSTLEVALRHGVTGYVMNLPDGNVEVVAEGPPEQVDAFWLSLRQHRIYRYVRADHPLTSPATGAFPEFTIRHF